MRPSIEDAKRLQRSRDLGYIHLVWLDQTGFTLAHTDYERRQGRNLEECSVHKWMLLHAVQPRATGWYTFEFDRSGGGTNLVPRRCGSIQPHIASPEC